MKVNNDFRIAILGVLFRIADVMSRNVELCLRTIIATLIIFYDGIDCEGYVNVDEGVAVRMAKALVEENDPALNSGGTIDRAIGNDIEKFVSAITYFIEKDDFLPLASIIMRARNSKDEIDEIQVVYILRALRKFSRMLAEESWRRQIV